VRTEDVERVRKVLHGDQEDQTGGKGHPLATDKTIEQVIERNMSFVANIQEHKRYLLQSVAGRRKSDKEKKRLNRMRRVSEHRGGCGGRSNVGHIVDDITETEDLINAILIKLGVPVSTGNGKKGGISTCSSFSSRTPKPTTPKPNSKGPSARDAIVEKLKDAITEDLEKHENEQRQTCVRAGGFWRYVGKPVFERMTEVASRIDWKLASS